MIKPKVDFYTLKDMQGAAKMAARMVLEGLKTKLEVLDESPNMRLKIVLFSSIYNEITCQLKELDK